jgi:glycosyltransferase involved in cell wall biosynthesis
MKSNNRSIVLIFSSLLHGGGRTYAETFAELMKGWEIKLCTIYDKEYTDLLAKQLGLKTCSLLDRQLLFDKHTLILSNSQISALIAAVLYPSRHWYVTHGYANGLIYASKWRRWTWIFQINLPGMRMIACGESERDSISRFSLRKNRVKLIRNSLPQKILSNDVDTIKICDKYSEKNHLVFVGRIAFQKGLDILLRALEEPALRNLNFKLTIVGNYQESEKIYCDQVRALIKQSTAEIEMLQPLKINFQFLRRFSALVAPSRFEGLPYTILEAGYSGLPIILSDCPGNCDIAPDNSYAYVFSSGDHVSLANCILDFFDSTSLESRVLLMQQHVRSDFTSEKFKNEYLEVLLQAKTAISYNS